MNPIEPLYPDVLGAIAGGLRVTFDDALQAAVGIFPHSAYLNQPVEVVVLLQNMIDQNVDVKVALSLPNQSAEGSPIKINAPQKSNSLTMSPGEVGVLRMPLVAAPPTQPSAVPVRVAIRYRAKSGKQVRTSSRGAPPSVLAVSPFKLQVLRDVEWVDHPHAASPELVTVSFDVAPKQLPVPSTPLKPSYEVLWTQEQMVEEQRNVRERMDEARLLAVSFTRAAVYKALVHATDEIYAARGLPLHPGEAKAIAKMLTYTLDDRSHLDPAYNIEDQRWFQTLCQVLAHDDKIGRWSPGELVTQYLYEPLVYESILLAFTLIRSRVRANLGDRAERINYANRVTAWLAGEMQPDLIYIYLPLALGGVVVNMQVTGSDDEPWDVVDGLREAYRGRIRLVEGDAMEIFDMLDKLLTQGEEELRRARIQR